jgi:hypothetical protein
MLGPKQRGAGMSFWKNLFGGGGGGAEAEPAPAQGETYKGFTIRPTPRPVGSEFQLAGAIEKEIDGALKTHEFVRADRLSSRDEAIRFALAKGRQLVDEQGDGLFGRG